jgi:hypothetical protein
MQLRWGRIFAMASTPVLLGAARARGARQVRVRDGRVVTDFVSSG